MPIRPLSRWGRIKERFLKTIDKQILQENPTKVAMGCALGIGINFLPTLGIGFLFAYVLAWTFRVSRASATASSLLAGPLVPLMYALNLFIGGLILTPATGSDSLREFVLSQYSAILRIGSVREKVFGFLEFFGSTFLLGALVNAALVGTAFYFFVTLVLKKRRHRDMRRE